MNISPEEALKKYRRVDLYAIEWSIKHLQDSIEFVEQCCKREIVDENGKPFDPHYLLGYILGASKNVVKETERTFEK